MAGKLSLKIGNWLYQNAFGIYNVVYPAFKRRQDKHEIAFIRKHVKMGDFVLDIGANIGFYAAILSNQTGPQGQVHAFEPDATNFQHLLKNIRNCKNVTANPLAVSSSNEPIKIYLSKELNVDHRTYPVDDPAGILEINATTIDSYLKPGQKVDFVKMDIQGFEIEALKGMKNTIASNPNIQFVMEFWPHGLRSAGYSVKELLALLDEYGLNYRLTDNELNLKNTDPAIFEQWGPERFTNLHAFKA